MNANLKSEINSCINELNQIAAKLEQAANEVSLSIKGMNTNAYTDTLLKCASKYRKAASRLSKIQ